MPFKHGIPSHDTPGDVMNALDGDLFAAAFAAFAAWVDGLRQAEPDIVALDGKTLRRAHAGGHPLHMVSARATIKHMAMNLIHAAPGKPSLKTIMTQAKK